MGKYNGKTVFITGSSRGVGEILTRHFLSEDAIVIGVSRGHSTFEHERYRHFAVDITDADSVQRMFATLRTTTKTLDIAINNAAVLTSQYAMIMPAVAAVAMANVNFLGTFLISREAAKLMRKTKWGRIINISSMAVSLEPEGDSVYAACKAAVSTLANVMAKEFASFNVTCNTLGITAIETDMLSQLPKDKIDAVVAGLPIPRYATADDILNAVDFFASDRSSYITAQTLYLGGVH